MEKYALNKEEIEALKDLFSDDSHSWWHARVEVMKNILPELFKEKFEKDKYYKVSDNQDPKEWEFYVRAVKTSEELFGYGLDVSLENYEHTEFLDQPNDPWADILEQNIEEITKEEFLEQIKKYAVEVLGFTEGVRFKNMNSGFIQTIESEDHRIGSKVNENEWISCGSTLKSQWGCKGSTSNACIFRDGKFAEIIEEPKEITTTDWKPTMVLRYKAFYGERDFEGEPVITNKWLEQKWIEQNTGAEEWREIETV